MKRQGVEDRTGMRMEGHLIFGTSLENDNSYKECFEFWRKYKWVGVDIVWLFLYLGTHYYNLACDKWIIKNKQQIIIARMPHLNITSMEQHLYDKYARISSLKSVLRSNGIRKSILSLNNILFNFEYHLEVDL